MEDIKGVGAVLREAREAKKLSIMDIEKAINVRSSYIQAIENEEFDKAPGDVFVRGIIRSYGNYLGLDGLNLVNMYRGSSAGEAARAAAIREVENVKMNIQLKEKRDIGSGRGGFSLPEFHLPMKQIAAGVGVLAVLGIGYFAVPKIVNYVQSIPVAQEEPTKPAAPAEVTIPAPLDKVVVEMEATGDCWLEVTADGKEAFAAMLYDKDKKTFEAKEKLVVKYGNIDVMKVVYNGKPVDFSGQHGVVISTYTKTE